MKTALSMVVSGVLTVGALAYACPALAEDEHKILAPADVKWGPAPPSIPKGAQVAVLYGDPAKDGLFAMRLKFPAGYQIPPHIHPKPEVVTILSGTLHFGEGDTADKSKAKALPAGSFFAMPTGMKHYAYADEETVLQINTNGPWGLTYVNDKDDPRKTQ